jgi:uncharacterized protein (DUF983 family)
MTPDEAYAIHIAGECPNCGGKQFFKDARGYVLRNMRCATPSCGLRINIVDKEMQDTVDLDTCMILGQILDAPANYKQTYGKRPLLYRVLKLIKAMVHG